MITEVTFYNLKTGVIVRRGMLDRDMVEANVQQGEGWIEGFYNANEYRIQNKQAVLIPKEELEDKAIDTAWAKIKQERNARLSASDWTQLPDVPLATKEAWATYRQALRDITNQPDPFTIQWPTQPE
jgi:hypothetical protein